MFFPNDHQFYAETTCNGKPPIDLIFRLLELLQDSFDLDCWASETPTPVTAEFLESKFEVSRKRVRRRPESNMPLSFVTASPSAEVRVLISAGSNPVDSTDADAFNILFNGDFKRPEPRYWLQAIELLRPFKARIGHCKNKNQVESQERIHRNGRYKPAGCFGLDYYSEPVLTNLGGKAHVLNTPAHRTSEFLDGVLIELVPGYYLDPNNPEHLKIQRQAMRHLGIDD